MKIRNVVDKVLEWVLVLLMSVLVFDVLWQVASRYIFVSPSSYTDELAGYLLIWVGMLGAAYVSGKREHLAIDLLLQRSSEKRKFKLEMIIGFTRFFLSVKSAALNIPLGVIYLVLPISGLLITYFNIDNMYNMIKINKKK